MSTKTWTILVTLDEGEDDTHADAVLNMGDKFEMRAHGFARKNPRDEAVPQVGDELAAARALSGLAHDLLDMASREIEQHTHQPVRSIAL